MTSFTPVASAIGGVLIGLSASAMLILNGRIAGISGIVGGALRPKSGDFGWRLMFVVGLLVGGALMLVIRPDTLGSSPRSLLLVALAGVIVGVGTQLGNGCTSGHGVCGMSRLSKRSVIATFTFMATGAATVFLIRRFS